MRPRSLPLIIAGLTPVAVLGLLLTFSGLSLVEWQPPAMWTAQFGTPGQYFWGGYPVLTKNSVTALADTSSGLYAGGFVGYVYPVGGFDNPATYMFLNKYDPTGKILWTQEFSDPSHSEIKAIAAGTDGVYIAATENLTGFVRKYDLNGTELWTKEYVNSVPCPRVQGGPYATNDFALSSAVSLTESTESPYGGASFDVPIDITSLGNFTGNVEMKASTSPNATNGVWAGFSSGPAIYSLSQRTNATAILFVDVPSRAPANTYTITATGSSGSLSHSITTSVVVMSTKATVQSSVKTLSGVSAGLSVSPGTNGVFAGIQCPSGGSNQNNVLARYDHDGNLLWTDSLGNSTQGSLNVYPSASRLFVAGYLSSAFLRSYDLNGTQYWARNFNCTCVPSSVSADSSGEYIIGYSNKGPHTTGFLAKYDLNGNQIWEKELDPPDPANVANLQMSRDPSGIYLAMTTTDNGLLMRYDTNGVQDWSFRIPVVLNSVFVAGGGVYLGGHYSFSDMNGDKFWSGFVGEFSSSSSLILFGFNPPYSFILLAALGGVVVLSVLWFRRRIRHGAPRQGNDPYALTT